jgi:hypothetical protein
VFAGLLVAGLLGGPGAAAAGARPDLDPQVATQLLRVRAGSHVHRHGPTGAERCSPASARAHELAGRVAGGRVPPARQPRRHRAVARGRPRDDRKSAVSDEDTLRSPAISLPPKHALIVGTITNNFPLVVAIDPLPEGFPASASPGPSGRSQEGGVTPEV